MGILWKQLLHIHVTHYILCMGMTQQHVKYQKVGVTKHQLALVMKLNSHKDIVFSF